MAETMYKADGVGLAAPQVGLLKRVIVVDIRDEDGLIKLVNPEIIEKMVNKLELKDVFQFQILMQMLKDQLMLL